jgi:hypothetical protein
MIRLALILLLASALAGGVGTNMLRGLVHSGGRTVEQVVRTTADPPGCVLPGSVAEISFSKTKYPHIREHELSAVHHGYPRVLVLTRDGVTTRREHLLEGVPTKPGYDRDEYPPAVGRSVVKADVAYVPSSENRSHGSVMGIKLRRYCSGTRFRYAWY